jgi:peptidoglycan-N-acetylglucosamine deacetylase
MSPISFSWPHGKAGALTSSWDDGTIHDRRLVSIYNRSGLKGTWNLNSGMLGLTAAQSGWKDYIDAAEVKDLYAGHEVACHTVRHPLLHRLPKEYIFSEVIEDRRNLERLVGYPVRGMALPFAHGCDAWVTTQLQAAGILYLRAITEKASFDPPGDFFAWAVTCHHKANWVKLWQKFQSRPQPDKVFFLWGHSYEFEADNNWDLIETFARHVSIEAAVWHASNMEIYEYVTAWRNLQCGVEMTCAKNSSGVTLWVRVGDRLRTIGPGEVIAL